MSENHLRHWRSMLFVPLSSPRFFGRAGLRDADAVVLDLEDSVSDAEKLNARRNVDRALESLVRQPSDVVVRINGAAHLVLDDLAAAVRPGVEAIMLPKVSDGEHARSIARRLEDLERAQGIGHRPIRLIPLIETPEALFNLRSIATASPRITDLAFGSEDMARCLDIEPQPEGLMTAGHAVVLAARLVGARAIGLLGSVADFGDLEALRRLVSISRASGFTGSGAIHPAQVPVLNEGFSPTPEEIRHAERVVAAYEDALLRGQGATSVAGKMVDAPVVERARSLLKRTRS